MHNYVWGIIQSPKTGGPIYSIYNTCHYWWAIMYQRREGKKERKAKTLNNNWNVYDQLRWINPETLIPIRNTIRMNEECTLNAIGSVSNFSDKKQWRFFFRYFSLRRNPFNSSCRSPSNSKSEFQCSGNEYWAPWTLWFWILISNYPAMMWHYIICLKYFAMEILSIGKIVIYNNIFFGKNYSKWASMIYAREKKKAK